MVFAQNGRAHAGRRRDGGLLDMVGSVIVQRNELQNFINYIIYLFRNPKFIYGHDS